MRSLIIILLTGLSAFISMFDEKASARTILKMEVTRHAAESAATCDRK